jgi:hypothetical protein
MFALAAVAAHGTAQSSEVLVVIVAIVIAAFWRFLLKLGIAIVTVMILVLLFGGASGLLHGLHG